LAIIDGKGTQHPMACAEDRCRPAGTQPVVEGEVGITFPQPVLGNVGHYDGFGTVGGSAAGTLGFSDGRAVDGTVVLRRQARGGPMAQVVATDRAVVVSSLSLGGPMAQVLAVGVQK